jgi:diguanylate cyclase (GGDEF)-like protein
LFGFGGQFFLAVSWMSRKAKDIESKQRTETEYRTKIDLLNDLAWKIRDTDPIQSKELGERAYQLANVGSFAEGPYLQGLAESLRCLAHANRRAGDLNLALSQSTQALSYLDGLDLPLVEADILRNIAISLGYLGNFAEGLEFGFKALKLANAAQDQERQALILGSIGVIYTHSKNLDESVRTFHQALRLNRELGDKQDEALILNNMSLAYRALGDYDNALGSSLQALKLAEETNFSALTVTATGTIGEAYLAMSEYDQANQYLQKYLEGANSTGSKRDVTWAFILLGETDYRRHQETTALFYLTQAIEIAQQLGFRSEEARSHELLANMYEQQGELKQALAHLRLFSQIRESIFNDDTARKIANLQVIHQVETVKRDAETHYLKTIELQKEIEERKKIESTLERLATIDPLTGILNRRKIISLVEKEFRRALLIREPLSLILLDVDHFKDINDNYGHAIGDQLLSVMTKTLCASLRMGDTIGRIGGDEFLIVLPQTDLKQGVQIAERLKKTIASQSFDTHQGALTLTISLGVAELERDKDGGIDVLIERTDQALYCAKRSGRNKVATSQDRCPDGDRTTPIGLSGEIEI